jgi:threonine/homoserine/homoserine lactone efflux protein
MAESAAIKAGQALVACRTSSGNGGIEAQQADERFASPRMPLEQTFAFFVFAVVAAVTPGPSNAMVMVAGARAGFVGGLPCLAGVVAGMALLMGGANLGLGGLVQASPHALVGLKWAGAALLLWLAWKVASAPAMSTGARDDPVGFWRALIFQWVNPKSWIVSVSAAATYGVGHGAGLVGQATLLASVFVLAAVPSCALWLAFGASLQRWLTSEARSRAFNVSMGIALAASVLLVLR